MDAVRLAALFLVAVPALAAKKPPPLPPLPPLVLAAAAPLVGVTIDGQTLRLRVDGNATRYVQLNGSAARRLQLAALGRLVGGKPVERGRSITQVGKVKVDETTSDELVGYGDRLLPVTVAWGEREIISGADGVIGPLLLPHDSVRWVARQPGAADRVVALPLRWEDGRGLLGRFMVGRDDIDIVITSMADTSITTAAAASLLAAAYGGTLQGPAREALIAHGVSRPVRDVVFARPVVVAGLRLDRVAARVFDWSGKTQIPDADIGVDEAVVAGRAGAQREWAKLAIGNDQLGACAEVAWTRMPLAFVLTCPAVP